MRDSVTVHMSATPSEVWALVSDVTRIGEFSPETFEAQWTGGATGPEVGATFRGHVNRNNKGVKYWTTCKVVRCEPGVEFTFDVLGGSKTVNTWGYTLVAAGDGTDVTEFFQLPSSLLTKVYWKLAGWARGKTNRKGMQTTLERIKAVVEA